MKNMNDKLTKEICEEAYKELSNTLIVTDYVDGRVTSINPICEEELEVFKQLINEHFNDELQIKFYYCESEDSYLIGKCVDNFYYAHWYHETGFVFDMSRYLPWNEHVIDEKTLWKEHTYPSEPKEINFYSWIKGFIKQIKKYNPPLKFEEMNDDMWIWDNEEKMYIHSINNYESKEYGKGLRIKYGFDLIRWKYEENRFYRKQVEE